MDKIKELLTRGVENVYPTSGFLEKLLKSKKKLTIYTGYDPTAPTLHIGHGITMLKLRQFQNLGHKIIFLIGDFTGMIGDPTDKTSVRQALTREEVLKNCKSYQKQASAILDFNGKNPVEVKYNSKWFSKMNFGDVLQLSSKFSVQRMMERDMFEKRFYGEIQCPNGHWMIAKNIMSFHINNNGELDTESIYDPIIGCLECAKTMDINSKNNFRFSVETAKKRPPTPIYVHEFMYPMMQAYDSVVMDVDGEVGGNDQTFNMLAGRDLMKQMKNKEKFVLTMKLLADTSGKKMGKSEGNMVALSDSPEDMFGKVMSWSDGMIAHGFELCTKVSDWELMKKEAKSNPRDTKLKLAYEVAKLFLGESSAKKGKAHFESVIVKKDAPSEMPEYKLKGSKNVADVLVESKLCSSKSDARRAIEQGGVSLDGNKIENFEEKAIPGILKKGKRHFVKII